MFVFLTCLDGARPSAHDDAVVALLSGNLETKGNFMEFIRIAQIVYVLFFLISTGILIFAVLAVVNWPQIHGRGLLFTALVVRLAAAAGYLLMSLLQIVSMFGQFEPGLTGPVIQGVYMLLAATSLVGDGLLLLSLIGLARALRDILHSGSLTKSAAHSPFEKA